MDRCELETREMVHAAHASLLHWSAAGDPEEEQRGLWLLARVSSEIGDAPQSTRHAKMCREASDAAVGQLADFDLVYTQEAEARASAIVGADAIAGRQRAEAIRLAREIADEETRELVLSDITAGNWGTLAE